MRKFILSIGLLVYSLIGLAGSVPVYTIIQDERGYNIYLSNHIHQSDEYIMLYAFLQQQKPKEIHLYLSGYGGRVSTVLDILSIKKRLNIKFHAHVYGNVYSGHALLALNSDTIETNYNKTFFMLHRPAIQGQLPDKYCNRYWFWDTDRGQSSKKKCLDNNRHIDEAFRELVLPKVLAVLTDKEKKAYYRGEDVYITWETLKKRLK